jgi:hypothetical protein
MLSTPFSTAICFAFSSVLFSAFGSVVSSPIFSEINSLNSLVLIL